ncbi:MAG: histidine phosphatase family protein [Actinomycetaceae bacterium]|nr:histidine phosphatase family protein [Actinomycetaceae bacterium]
MTRKTIILWRHGQPDYNHESRVQGHVDVPLNNEGKKQAAVAASHLVDLDPQLIVSSPLKRATQTADELCSLLSCNARLDERLIERSFGDFEGMTRKEIQDTYPQEYERWISGLPVGEMGMESRENVGERFARCVNDICARNDGSTIVFVSHGSAISAGVSYLLGCSEDFSSIAGMNNAHWATMVFSDTSLRWRLTSYNCNALEKY